MEKYYLCIDLKSFFASVECVERGLDPFETNLVVSDSTRGKGAICLAVSPALKSRGVANRCRLFEIPDTIEYLVAKPRMNLYIEYSANIYETYLKYISKEDIHIYSIDECFFDITSYLELYNKTPRELAVMLIDAVYKRTGVRATAGIGTNLFLAKVALDITAKHADDFIGYLDIDEFKKSIWHHKPMTDVWNVGRGIANRLEKYGVYDLYGITGMDERILYREFGVNAEYLIDHAKGIEPCTIADIKNYETKTTSLSNSQILFEDYSFNDARLVLKEMVDILVLELVDKNLVTNTISLRIGYSDSGVKSTGGSLNIGNYTNSQKKLTDIFMDYYDKTTHKNAPIRKLTVVLNNLVVEEYLNLDFFSDFVFDEKERKKQKAIIEIKKKYGKNAILKGMNYKEKATGRIRNKLVGGHNGD
ncbi:MAG: DNA repair protein [Ruminococcaceae bacterium]|nr:DNA repair protein [Oscillospiraceae bacterium]